MRKIFPFLFVFVLVYSCSEKEEIVDDDSAAESTVLPYDTTAIDSFAPGANSGNVIMNRVEIDSEAVAKMEEAKLATKKKEAEKKKAEETDKKKKTEEKPKEKISMNPTEDQK